MCVFRVLVHEWDFPTHARLTMENIWSEMDLIKSFNLEVYLGSMTSLPNPSRLLQRMNTQQKHIVRILSVIGMAIQHPQSVYQCDVEI